MSGGGSPKNVTQTTKVDLPSWYTPLAKEAAERGYAQSLEPYQQYQGQRIAPLTSEQIEGLTRASERALAAPITTQATTQAMDTLSGKYLDPTTNPAWQSGVEDITRAYQTGVAPTRNTLFSKAGAFGADNSAFNQYATQQEGELGRGIGSLWGDIYGQERGRQMQTLALSPALAQSGYMDAQNLIGVGDALRQFDQDVLNLGYQDFQEQRDYPWNQLSNFANLGPALLGNTGTTISKGPNPYQTSPLAGALGGGLLGAGAYGLLGAGPLAFSNPYALAAAGGGALLGGLLS